MTTHRLIQNFRQNRAVLWAGPDFHAETLERTLLRLGLAVMRFDEIDHATLDHHRDVLFVDGDQHFNPATLLATGSLLPIVPVIGIVGVEAPSRLKLLAEAGATAFIRKPVAAAAVYSVLFLGVNNFRRMRALELRLAEQDRKRHGRRFVVKAIVALCRARGIDDDEAYAELRRESMRRRLGVEEFCEALMAEGGSVSGLGPESFIHRGEISDASTSDIGCGSGGTDDADGGTRRGPNQARRA